jgi:hypothetical protein
MIRNDKFLFIEEYEIKPSKWVSVVRCNQIGGGFKRLAIDGVYSKTKANNLVVASGCRDSSENSKIKFTHGVLF